MADNLHLGNIVATLFRKIDRITQIKCPECKSTEYEREFLFKDGLIPNVPPISFSVRTLPLSPLYKYECKNCEHEWYS